MGSGSNSRPVVLISSKFAVRAVSEATHGHRQTIARRPRQLCGFLASSIGTVERYCHLAERVGCVGVLRRSLN